MKKSFCSLLFLLSLTLLSANDGAFHAAGNQLIPINESDIRVQKEILTINRVGNHLEVTVYYEFFNPVDAKDLLVGFEAPGPYDADFLQNFPQQTYISDFVVMMNGDILPYEIAHVQSLTTADGTFYEPKTGDEDVTHAYFQNGKIQSLTRQQCEDMAHNNEGLTCPFHYVYHFKAHFNKGLNIIRHTYHFELSAFVGDYYWFDYILTAANRWANHQIDDFTLDINMGDCESFALQPTFFNDCDEWSFTGAGRKDSAILFSKDYCFFHVQSGSVRFHKENFHPDGELHIRSPHLIQWFWNHYYEIQRNVNWLEGLQWEYFPLDEEALSNILQYIGLSSLNEFEKSVVKNLPLAYRGYIFEDKKDKKLQKFFSESHWYVPNPDYKPYNAKSEFLEWRQYWGEWECVIIY